MKYVCEKEQCTGCGVCSAVCPRDAVTIKQDFMSCYALIDETKCIRCHLCEQNCQVKHPLETRCPQKWYQGWAENNMRRENGSSGGVAGSISAAFIRKGGVVASCTFSHGEFCFSMAEKEEDVSRFSGSKYVKSTPGYIYKMVLSYLEKRVSVLFLALPCQVAAMKQFIPQKLQGKLYTADLICHGTPSTFLLNAFLKQYGTTLSKIDHITFRKKNYYQVRTDSARIVRDRIIDRYMLAFLMGLSFTDNCYRFPYAKTERVSDLTLGDSWGSDLAYEERRQGISLMLCQTDKGEELLYDSDLHLESVDLQKAIQHNHQLKKSSLEPLERKRMFAALSKGLKFNTSVMVSIPVKCIRQDIKSLLLAMKEVFWRKK